ncbi:MAG: DoxX family protein [Campylobacterota bacterium]|nr:DoxX family protein [Campylobacterota bacterium]
MFQSNDIGKLILRVSVGVLILFHGMNKIIYGVGGVKHLLSNAGFPEFLAYGVYVGEVIVPIFLILGLYARVASLVLAFNMFVAIILAHGGAMFSLSKHGGLVIELPLFYLIASIVVFILGSGRYAVNSK